jgi:hypothetical protein
MDHMDDMMNGDTSSDRGRWRGWSRRAGVLAVTVGVVVLAAACNGSPSSTGPGGSTNAGGSTNSSLLAFSQCMRSQGVPNFPDSQPGASNAKFPGAQQLGVSSSLYQAAENACEHLLPAGANNQFPPAEMPQILSGMREFSQCMRSHGVPNWPDPTTNSSGQPSFNLVGISGLNSDSPKVTATRNECSHLLPHQLKGIPVRQP